MPLDKATLSSLQKLQKSAGKLVLQNRKFLQTLKKARMELGAMQRDFTETVRGPAGNAGLRAFAQVKKEMDSCIEYVDKRGVWGGLHEEIDQLVAELKRSAS